MALVHDLEGTPDLTAVTGGVGGNSNTAGNNYFDSVSIGASGSLEYCSTPEMAGNRHLRVRAGASGVAVFPLWNTSRPLITDDFSRFLFRIDAVPTLNNTIAKWESVAAASMGSLDIFGTGSAGPGKLGIRNSSGSAQTLTGTGTIYSATALAVNTTYRIEFKHHADTVNGLITVRIYTDPLESIPNFTEEFSAAAVFTMPTAQSDTWFFGLAATGANQPSAISSEYLRFDAVVNSAPDWVGPVVTNRPLRTVRGSLRW